VDQGGQLVEADDAEEVAQQAGATGDGSLQAVASAVVGDEPDHQGEDAVVADLGLVFLVAPAGGDAGTTPVRITLNKKGKTVKGYWAALNK